MEFIEGIPLRTYISEHAPLPLNEALSIASQLADTIEYLHTNGVYHRDLKPENIIIGPDGKIHILDFGSAPTRRFPTCNLEMGIEHIRDTGLYGPSTDRRKKG